MKTYGIVVLGQSNEEGPAAYSEIGQTAKFNTIYGRQANDLVVDGTKSPSHWRGTVWSLLGHKLKARKNISVIWRNAAIGGTGAFDAWAGGITTWENNAAGFGLAGGTWVLPTVPNGFKYKANASGSQSATTEPTWNTTLGGSTVDDGITWTTFAADSNDFPNRAYSSGQSGYDPNGYIAQAKSYMTALMAKYPNLDKYIFIIGGNQADLAFRYKTPLMVFGARSSIINDLRTSFPKAYVGIALTCYWNTGFETGNPVNPRPRSYDDVLQPAYNMTVNRFKNDPNVFEAGNWFTGLGKSISFARQGSDAIHMAPNTTEDASEVSYNACVYSGLF